MKKNSAESFDSLFEERPKGKGFKIFILIIVLALLTLLGIYAYLNVKAVRNKMAEVKSNVSQKESVDPGLVDLMKEKAWMDSRLKMANDDSIGLAIDLEEKVIQLELKGVVVMKSKIRDFSISGFFSKMDANVYFEMFGTPLNVKHIESSIKKNEFKVKIAPKDTIEFMAQEAAAAKADSIQNKKSVFWTVEFDKDIELNIQGIDSVTNSSAKFKLGEGFEFERDMKNIANSFKQIISFKAPSYTPEILIGIPENEARTILNALPKRSMVTIKI